MSEREKSAWSLLVVFAIGFFAVALIAGHYRGSRDNARTAVHSVIVPHTETVRALKACKVVEIDFGAHKAPEVIGKHCG